MATNQGFKSLIPKREILDAKYLFYWLRANRTYLDSLGNGATFKEVSKATVSRVQIPLPSLTEQRRIAAILDRIDLLRAKRHESLSCLEALAQSAFVEWFGDPGVASPTWQLARLDQIATVVSGATPRTGVDDYWNGEIRWVTPRDLSELSGIYIAETARRITEAGLRACGATLLPIGAVLFSSRAPIGHTAICSAPMATNQGFKSFIPKPDRLDAHYLLQWLRLRRSYLEGLGTGATFKELSKSAVAQIQVPVPPIDLQRRFSAFSIELESVRSKQQASLSHAEQLYTSVEHRAFRGEL